jgi:hypothetical protein
LHGVRVFKGNERVRFQDESQVVSWGGKRPGSGRPAKRLVDRVRDGSFQATRHRALLAIDNSILEPAEEDFGDIDQMDEAEYAFWSRLAEIQQEYRELPSFAGHMQLPVAKDFERAALRLPGVPPIVAAARTIETVARSDGRVAAGARGRTRTETDRGRART